MSILIKGMQMPENCGECDFLGYDDNGEHICDITQKAVEDDCPLIEIPDMYIDISKAFMTELTDKVCRKEEEDG